MPTRLWNKYVEQFELDTSLMSDIEEDELLEESESNLNVDLAGEDSETTDEEEELKRMNLEE